ncbi:LUD domain-containing protein, partial [Acidipropionibacterium jensenii]
MGTELRRITDGNHGVARLTPAPDHGGTFLGMPKFQKAVKHELELNVQRKNMRNATTTIRNKRALRVSESPDWEELREAATEIKNRVSRHLDYYLEEAEKSLTAHGVHVHWARDGQEANQIVAEIAQAKGVDEVVKIKSITTQETDLNEYLEEQGIAAWETDLAELIVQLGHDRPSHIVVPAIHRNRAEVREIFLREMKNYGRPAPEDVSENPPELANAARLHLREKFLRAKMAVSGGNFVLADTGSLVIVESEGNGRMCLTLPDTLVSMVGIEKILPSFDDLEVFLKLLPRSATGERMNPYNSVWSGVTDGDGPQEQHVIFMDNGRT